VDWVVKRDKDLEALNIITNMLLSLYGLQFKYVTFRKVFSTPRGNLFIKVGLPAKIAELDLKKPVYVYYDRDEIVINQHGKGVKRKITDSRNMGGHTTQISLTSFLRPIGIDKGDVVIIKVKNKEIRVSNPKRDKQLLEAIKRYEKEHGIDLMGVVIGDRKNYTDVYNIGED